MPQPVQIVPMQNPAERMRFIKFQWKIYANDPNWVPPLLSERKQFLDPDKNPSFKHMEVALFMARRGGEDVGTIAAFINRAHNDFHEEKTGFFGFFETINDAEVAKALLDTARDWVKGRGMERLRGPAQFSTNDECGLLVDGFDSPPMVFMTYNPRYYIKLLEDYGFVTAQNLFAYIMEADAVQGSADNFPKRLGKVVERARAHTGATVRSVTKASIDEDAKVAIALYNSSWERNWGFVPMTPEETEHLKNGLKQFADFDIIKVAEVDGKAVGFGLLLPDVCQALVHVRSGTLFPFGWLPFLYYQRKITNCRVFALGVIPEYRSSGLDALLYYETAKAAFAKGYKHFEMSWILESNDMMNRAIRFMGGRVYKTYRFYDLFF